MYTHDPPPPATVKPFHLISQEWSTGQKLWLAKINNKNKKSNLLFFVLPILLFLLFILVFLFIFFRFRIFKVSFFPRILPNWQINNRLRSKNTSRVLHVSITKWQDQSTSESPKESTCRTILPEFEVPPTHKQNKEIRINYKLKPHTNT